MLGKPLILAVLATGAFAAGAALVQSQPPPPGGRQGGGGPPGRPELGSVLPPFVREKLTLTADQQKAIAEMEKEVKARLQKILTADQLKQAEEAMKQGPGGRQGGPGGGRPGGPGGPGGPPPGEGGNRPQRPEGGAGKPAAAAETSAAGIQWFATLDRGLAEAQRTGKPILFLSAAPHCGGISGIW
jgi:hypothetical protein